MSHKIYMKAMSVSATNDSIPKVWAPVDKTLKIMPFGKDNMYPQRVDNILKKSAAGIASVNLFHKFIKGQGLTSDTLAKTIVNHKRETVDKLLRKITKDYSKFKGFAIHLNYNILGEITSMSHIPFEYCRRGEPDDYEFVNKIAVYNDWSRYKRKNYKRSMIVHIDTYNPDPDAVLAQIEKAGGITEYKGQIFYWCEDDDEYPLASFDPVLKDIETDSEVSSFKNTNIKTNFLASHVLEYPGKFPTENEKMEFNGNLKTFQGAKNASKMMVIENEHLGDGKGIKIHKVDIQNSDKLFEWTETSTQKKIRMNYSQPPVLLGDLIPGKLGGSEQIKDAVNFYNAHTVDDRMVFEETLEELFQHWAFGDVGNDFSIEPIVFASEEQDQEASEQPAETQEDELEEQETAE